METMNYRQLAEEHNIKVGNRYRIDHLCSDNDREITSIDFETGKATIKVGIYKHSCETKIYTTSIQNIIKSEFFADRWIQIDEHRHDIN